MTELKLLNLLNTKLREERLRKIEFDISKDSNEKEEYQNELNRLEDEIKKINLDLKSIENKEHSKKARINMINQLSAYIQEIDDAPDGSRLTRNQGFIIDNYLFCMIIGDLLRLVSPDIFNGVRHHYLEYAYGDEESVNKTDLRNFLNQEIQILTKIENPNFVELRDYISDLEKRILEKYIE